MVSNGLRAVQWLWRSFVRPVILPFASVVFFMCEHVANVEPAAIKMHDRNEPILVAANFEHDPLTHFICGWERGAEGGEGFKGGMSHNLEPSLDRRLAVGMFLPEYP